MGRWVDLGRKGEPMPVPTETLIAGPFYPNGSVTAFPFDFKAISADEVIAVSPDGSTIPTALYSVTVNPVAGGSLNFATPPTASEYPVLFVIGRPALTQSANFDNSGPSFNPAALTRAFDAAALRDLRQQVEIDRGLKVPFGEGVPILPPAADRRGRFLGFSDVDGSPVIADGTTAEGILRPDLASTDPDKGAALVGFRRNAAGSVSRTAESMLQEAVFTPQDFGAVGDGAADDTVALQNALNAARTAEGEFRLTKGTYRVTGNLFAYNGIRRIVGQGGTILLDHASGQRSFILAVTGGVPVSSCLVEGIVIDANGKQTLGIYGQNIRDTIIRGNRVFGLTAASGTAYGIFVKSVQNFALEVLDVRIEGNRIEGQQVHASHSDGQQGIVVAGDWVTPYNGYPDATAEWKATFANIPPDYYARRIVVRGNIVSGCRYGISLVGSRDCTVSENQCHNNTRSISLQLHANSNVVVGNLLKDFLACACEIGYSSSGNLVGHNNCLSSVANSLTEGAIFAYVGCSKNRVAGNKIDITSADGPAYMLYTAIMSEGNTFQGNIASGPVRRAFCAAESSWKSTVTNTAHRAQGQSSALNGFANVGMQDVSFVDNEIDGGSARPAFFLGQITDSASRLLGRVTIAGNRVRGSCSRVIEVLEETSGLSQNHAFSSNRHIFGVASGFLLPRGIGHFILFEDPKLSYTATWDPPSIAPGASASTSVPLSGAAIGDIVSASFSLDLAGLSINAYVNAANQVTVTLSNNTAGAVDLGSGTVRVRASKQ